MNGSELKVLPLSKELFDLTGAPPPGILSAANERDDDEDEDEEEEDAEEEEDEKEKEKEEEKKRGVVDAKMTEGMSEML
jgi:ribosomal protein L12E/L44/L45/RPP1/RPP2